MKKLGKSTLKIIVWKLQRMDIFENSFQISISNKTDHNNGYK
jgi:hypothetical protein